MSLASLTFGLLPFSFADIFSDNNVVGTIVTRQWGFNTRILIQKEQSFITFRACLDTIVGNGVLARFVCTEITA